MSNKLYNTRRAKAGEKKDVARVKKVEAFVRREKFADVDEALKRAGVSGLTYSTAEGRGRAKGEAMLSDRGTKTYRPEYVSRIKVEIIVKDSDAQRVVDTILGAASTGEIGDGKIIVTPVDREYDISSKENEKDVA